VVSSTPRLHFTTGKDPVPILQEAVWAPGPVWTGEKSRPHRDSIPDRPAHSSVAIPTELPGPHVQERNIIQFPTFRFLGFPKNTRKIRKHEARFLIILDSARNFKSDPQERKTRLRVVFLQRSGDYFTL